MGHRPSGQFIVVFALILASILPPTISRGDDTAVRAILAERCVACHNASDHKGGLDLTNRDSALAGGESGRVIELGKPAESLLWQYVSSGEMPPKKPLLETEQLTLRRWIENGAPWPGPAIDPYQVSSDVRAGYDWWSLQPVTTPRLPDQTPTDRDQNAIDRFIRVRLEAAALEFSPSADRRTLIRRLYCDLLGLLPAPEEVKAFVEDTSPDAYEQLVDRLLASPQYGERWARHWLDVARFGESQGFERDKLRPQAWRYRDWVIDAFNEDMPYHEFASLQIAGDVLRDDDSAAVATGFLVAGPYDEVGQQQQSEAMRFVVREDELEDVVSTVGQTFLGLTVNCARCHDHKFDPIRQTEYYQLCASLAGVRHGERSLQKIEDAAIQTATSIAARVRVLEEQLCDVEILPSPSALQMQQQANLDFELQQLRQHVSRVRQRKTYAVTPKPPPRTHVLLRGNPGQKGNAALPGGIVSLRMASTFSLPESSSDSERRRKLAEWITSPANPLFARVMVNRLWHYHFGMGLVDTPNDFGFNGGRPTHPQLLDWLANELILSGWSVKHIQRLIVLSGTYRQASLFDANKARIDADNRLLWRMNPRRLEAETLRDIMLQLSDQLDSAMHGPGYYDFKTYISNSQFYEMLDPIGTTFQRRSLYRTWLRSGRSPLLDVFDCPDPSAKTPQRAITTTPLQALSLLNNSFVLRMVDRLAARVQEEVGENPHAQLERLFRYAYGRKPENVEETPCVELIRHHGLAAMCRVVLNSNELLYVD